MGERYTSPEFRTPPPIEFVIDVNHEFISLSRDLEESDKDIEFGSVFRTTTSSGLNMAVRVFSANKDLPGNWLKRYFLTVEDESGNIIGKRTAILGQDFEDPDKLEVKGDIAVRLAGQGVASKTEEIFAKLLQQEANRMGKPLTWKVHNGNLAKLNNLREQYQTSPNPELAAQISQTEIKPANQMKLRL